MASEPVLSRDVCNKHHEPYAVYILREQLTGNLTSLVSNLVIVTILHGNHTGVSIVVPTACSTRSVLQSGKILQRNGEASIN